ncbi:MAG: hypothetical protein ABSD98_18680 [Candidatus Korobacteraceae bacterium]|jgi:hypothetical protein
MAVALATFVSACGHKKPPEKYRVVASDDGLSCEFSQEISASLGPGLSGTIRAVANHFECKDKMAGERELELESVGIENGKVAIRTKKFGTVYRGDEPGNFSTYEMTDSQIRQIKTFLETGEDGSRAGQIGWVVAGVVAVIAGVVVLAFLRRTRLDSVGISITPDSDKRT